MISAPTRHPSLTERPPAKDVVALVVLSPGEGTLTGEAKAAIRSVLSQTVLPDAVLVVSTGSERLEEWQDSRVGDTRLELFHASKAKNLGQAVTAALAEHGATLGRQWIWIVHDDMIAESDALERMLESGRISLSVGALGPKQVDYDQPERILEIGIEATRTARRADLIEPDEIDQGQHDHLEDVLAVGTAGMLIRRSAWDTVGGFDSSLGPFGDGLEFGRRLWRAGFRVVAEPKAVVRHKQTAYSRETKGVRSFGRRRGAQLYNWVLTVPTVLLFPLMVWLPIWTGIRGGGRLLRRQPRLAAAEIYAYLSLVKRGPGVFRQRKKIARVATVPKSALRELEALPSDIAATKRHQQKVLARGRIRVEPLDQAALASYWRYRYVSAATLAALVVAATLFSVFIWAPVREGVQGGAWGTLPESWLTLMDQAWSGWQISGDGAAGPAATTLLPFTLLSAPFALLGIVPSTFQMVLLVSALPLSVLGGWLAVSTFVRSIVLRVSLATLWAATGTVWTTLVSGDMGIVIAYLALPLLFTGLWRGFRPASSIRAESVDDVLFIDQPDRFAWLGLAGLALLGVAPSSPVMVGVTLLAAALMAGSPSSSSPYAGAAPLGRWKKLGGIAVIGIPTLVWMAPAFVVRIARLVSGASPLGDSGTRYSPSDFWNWLLGAGLVGDVPAWWQLLSGYPVDPATFGPSAPGSWPAIWLVLVTASGAVLIAWALGSVAYTAFRRGRADKWRRTAPLTMSALLLWALTLTGPTGGYSAVLIAAGSLALVGAVAAALPETRLWGARFPAGTSASMTRKVQRVLGALGIAAAVATLVAGTVFGGIEPLTAIGSPDQDVRGGAKSEIISSTPEGGFPLTAKEAQTGPRAARILSLNTEGSAVTATLLRGPGLQLSDVLAGAPDNDRTNSLAVEHSRTELASAVAALVTGTQGDVAWTLSGHAIDIVLLEPGGEGFEEYVNQLDATAGLERIGSVDAGTMWRVRWEGMEPARVTLRDSEGNVDIIDSGPLNAGQSVIVEDSKVLVLAETSDPNWVAKFDGTVLTRASDDSFGWQQVWDIPEGAGNLTIRYAPPYLRWWQAASGLALMVLVSSAIPWRYRRPQRIRVGRDANE